MGTPSVAALGAKDAARSAAPPVRSTETSGSPFSAECEPWTRTFRPVSYTHLTLPTICSE
eukprot:10245994-Alexandrium_andersonii.AAC.1